MELLWNFHFIPSMADFLSLSQSLYISLIYKQTKYPQKVILAIGHPKTTHFIFSESAAVMIGDHDKI